MSRNREFARQVESAVNGVSGRVRHYADEATGVGNDLLDRSRRVTNKFAKHSNGSGQRMRYLAEDFADPQVGAVSSEDELVSPNGEELYSEDEF